MRAGNPSRTAAAAAAHRAAHQLLERGSILDDPLAVRLFGAEGAAALHETAARPDARALRFFVAARHRFAEDALADGVARGVRQAVVLGAGLDTFAYRNPHRDLRVFEADHPATQAWKRERLSAAGVAPSALPTFVPIDFERDVPSEHLIAAGFDPARQSFFTWLGVVPYLSTDAVFATLADVAAFAGAAIVFDYADPPATRTPDARAAHARRASRVEELGEPWVTFFEPAELHVRLRTLGFACIDDAGPCELVRRYAPHRAVPATDRGGHVLLAERAGAALPA